MKLLRSIVSELFAMFAGDAALTLSILGVVALAGALRFFTPFPRLGVGAILLFGCVAALAARVVAQARK